MDERDQCWKELRDELLIWLDCYGWELIDCREFSGFELEEKHRNYKVYIGNPNSEMAHNKFSHFPRCVVFDDELLPALPQSWDGF